MRDTVVYTLMFSALLQLLMAVYAWSRRNEPAAKPLTLVFVLGFVWASAYGMDMASSNLQAKIVWMQIATTFVSFGPLAFLLIVLEHLEIRRRLTGRFLAILLIVPLILIALVWTGPYHHLFRYDFTVVRVGSLDILQWKNGILFMPIMLALQGLSIITYYLLVRSLSGASWIRRQQTITILFAMFILFVVNGSTILNISPIKGFDFTPHALVISGGLFAFAIFRYRWLDILPLARTMLVEVIPVSVVVLDAKNRIVDINPAAQQLLQVTASTVGQETQVAFARFDTIFRAKMDMEMFKKEIKVEMPRGQPEHFEVQMMPLKDQAGQFKGRIIMFHDITEHKQAEAAVQYANERLQAQLAEIESLHAQLREQAIRDSLTGLFNRRYLDEALEREAHRAERHQHPLSLLMIEVDSFKKFNDTFGHETGDVILRKVAELIQANTRAGDIACRYGGDEFTLILPETMLEAAKQCAERLREDAMHLHLLYSGKALGDLTLSIGMAVFPKHGVTGALALQAADEAMYRAKQAGKNRVVVAPG